MKKHLSNLNLYWILCGKNIRALMVLDYQSLLIKRELHGIKL